MQGTTTPATSGASGAPRATASRSLAERMAAARTGSRRRIAVVGLLADLGIVVGGLAGRTRQHRDVGLDALLAIGPVEGNRTSPSSA